jgi:PqqD family protein of HPr-rel-A system
MPDPIFRQSGTESLSIERLPDGSTAIVDNRSKSVHSLNPSATLVWEACAEGAAFAEIHAAVEQQAGVAVDAELIRQALAQLQRVNLIESPSALAPSAAMDNVDLGRRSLLKRAGAAGAFALPVVLTLTAAEQKAYAFQSQSTTLGPVG